MIQLTILLCSDSDGGGGRPLPALRPGSNAYLILGIRLQRLQQIRLSRRNRRVLLTLGVGAEEEKEEKYRVLGGGQKVVDDQAKKFIRTKKPCPYIRFNIKSEALISGISNIAKA